MAICSWSKLGGALEANTWYASMACGTPRKAKAVMSGNNAHGKDPTPVFLRAQMVGSLLPEGGSTAT